MSRMVVVLEYDVMATKDGRVLDRIAAMLRERAVHDPVEGARQVQATVAIAEAADAVVAVFQGEERPVAGQPPRRHRTSDERWPA